MSKQEEIFKVECAILKHTEKAVLIEVYGERVWIPRSQLFDEENLPELGAAEIKMTAWIAKEKGLR